MDHPHVATTAGSGVTVGTAENMYTCSEPPNSIYSGYPKSTYPTQPYYWEVTIN